MCHFAVCKAEEGDAISRGGRSGLEGQYLSYRGRGGSLFRWRGDLIRASACIPLWSHALYYYLLPRVNWLDRWDQSDLHVHTHTPTPVL